MNPRQIRDHILREHREIRRLLERLECSAQLLRRGGTPLKDARNQVQELRDRIASTIELEDALLSSALRTADAWGQARVDELHAHHRVRRDSLAGLGEPGACNRTTLAERWQHCAAHLRRELEQADAELLRSDILRDDVIGIDVECG